MEQIVDSRGFGGGLQDFLSQDKVHPLLLTIQLVSMKLWMGLVQGFSLFSPK